MVMATGSVCQQYAAGELPHEAAAAAEAEAEAEAGAGAGALHERLVAYVHALAAGQEPRSGVWGEHSYARARGAPPPPAAHVRVLLAPAPPAPPAAELDVERASPPPPPLPGAAPPAPDDDEPRDHTHWEERLAALAPSAAHARLADAALDALRRMRLERLAAAPGARREDAARTAARRLRLALAAAHGQRAPPAAPRAAAWLHATLTAQLPRGARRLYDELLVELGRAAPRLAARLAGARPPAPRPDPLGAVGAARADSGPLLLWLGSGRARLDLRWRRRLGALVALRALATAAPARAPPAAWCAAAAAAARQALADALADAGERPVILGGIGAGAALCVSLAGAARARGLLLLAPPLLTAEGPRDLPDDPLAELRLPMLVVVGTGAAQCWRGAVREVSRRADAPPRRVLELRGADDALRLPRALRRRRRLPQHALDAAVAEECARWAIETATSPRGESPARERPRRRDARAPALVRAAERVLVLDDDDDEYAHLPAAAPAPAAHAAHAAHAAGSERPPDIVGEYSGRRPGNSSLDASNSVTLGEGRVVSRGQGGTPLALLPPRRRAPSPAAPAPAPAAPPAGPAPLAAADILRLPIVFADDEPALEAEPAGGVTVTAGARGGGAARYTRVIVASRGGRGGAAAGARGARPVLLRRGVRVLPRVERR